MVHVMGRLFQENARNRRGILTRCVLLLQDNAPAHTTECGFQVLPYSPYSPDMAPSDFYQLPKLKSNLRGKQFGSNAGVKAAVNEYLADQDFYLERDKQAQSEMD